VIGDLVVLLHPPHRHGRRKSRGTHHHRFEQAELPGQRHDGLRRHPGELRKTAVQRFANVAAGDEYPIARGETAVGTALDHTRQIDAGGAYRSTRYRCPAADRERVLVVEARVGDTNHDLAGGEIVQRHRIEPGVRAALDPMYT
jgi:hypothetical protein